MASLVSLKGFYQSHRDHVSKFSERLHFYLFNVNAMGKNLYVGGISYNTSEDALREAFEKAGPVVSAKIITDRMSGRSKGFGFVEMETEEGAQAAIDMWNGKELDARKLVVNEARPPRKRFEGGGGGGDFGGDGGDRF